MPMVFMCGEGMIKLMECAKGILFMAVMLGGLLLLNLTLSSETEENPHPQKMRHAR
jgi:hypothetical protein